MLTTLLSLHHVKRTLDDLHYGTISKSTYSNFAKLQLVQNYLAHLPKIPVKRMALLQYAVQSLFSDLIEQNLKQQRSTLHLKHRPFSTLETYRQAVRDIERDASTHNRQLIGWSLLYYVYVRADFGISHQQFAQLTHLNERTVRRYKQHVIRLLLQEIIDLEVNLSGQADELSQSIFSFQK